MPQPEPWEDAGPSRDRYLEPLGFGQRLLATQDLDPVPLALHHLHLPPPQLRRFLLAWWLYDHPGTAALLSESKGGLFWIRAAQGLEDEDGGGLPRGPARRNYHGEGPARVLRGMQATYPQPETLVNRLTPAEDEPLSFDAHRQLILNLDLPFYHPWMSFRVADTLERLLGARLYFDREQQRKMVAPGQWERHDYLEPPGDARPASLPSETDGQEQVRYGAMLASRAWTLGGPEDALDHLAAGLRPHPGPPRHRRLSNAQECVLVLRKFGAHARGSYGIGQETLETLAAWRALAACRTARRLAEVLQKFSLLGVV